jgi:hypothetical protein
VEVLNSFSKDSGQSGRFTTALTLHAAVRVQQRGVGRDVLDCLLRHGRHEHDHNGCEIVMFDDTALEAIARQEPFALWQKASESRSLYAVVDSEGAVITAGHRFRRVLRDKSISSYRSGRSRRPDIQYRRSVWAKYS